MKLSTKSIKKLAEKMSRMIDDGMEYPDAHTKICWDYNLTAAQDEKLVNAYDELGKHLTSTPDMV